VRAGERREQVLAAIEALTAERGFPPTLRELGARVGLRSMSAVRFQLCQLEAEGRIAVAPGLARGIRVVAPTADGGVS